jgi:hypothetical protein
MVVRDTPVARDTATWPPPDRQGLGRYKQSPHPFVHRFTQQLVAMPNPSFIHHPSSIHHLHWLLHDESLVCEMVVSGEAGAAVPARRWCDRERSSSARGRSVASGKHRAALARRRGSRAIDAQGRSNRWCAARVWQSSAASCVTVGRHLGLPGGASYASGPGYDEHARARRVNASGTGVPKSARLR